MILFIFFVFLCISLGFIILLQQGKGGGLGLEGIARSSQALFGGSGGQDFFTKTTWVLGGIFMIAALSFSIFKGTDTITSRLKGQILTKKIEIPTSQEEITIKDNSKDTEQTSTE
ncbi:MAG TPA: preprotein translocase subunit SecG [Candidatus Babeliales bacterium]|nr:preprotein translocase subunit SecG [Candidatus Babeliales bacterium]